MPHRQKIVKKFYEGSRRTKIRKAARRFHHLYQQFVSADNAATQVALSTGRA